MNCENCEKHKRVIEKLMSGNSSWKLVGRGHDRINIAMDLEFKTEVK